MGLDLDKWGQLASNNSAVSNAIQKKASHLKDSEEDSSEDVFPEELSGMQDRAAETISNNPDFTKNLFYIFFGDEAEERLSRDKSKAKHESKSDSKGSGKDKTKLAKKLLKHFTAEEIKGLCRNRYSLMSMEDFLLLLNRLNSASDGRLLQDK